MRDRFAIERLVAPLIERQARIERDVARLYTLQATPTFARYTTATAHAINHGTITIVDYGTAVYDTLTEVTTGASWKYTARAAGYRHVDAQVVFASSTAWAATEQGALYIYKNGAEFSRIDFFDDLDASAHLAHLGGSDLVYLAQGDYIDIRVYQEGASPSLALNGSAAWNHVSIARIV